MDVQNQNGSDQLSGWKEIAAYVGKGTRTAQRWEKLGMPVHRVANLDGVVYAFRSEIDAWRQSSAGRDAETSSGDHAVNAGPFISSDSPVEASAGAKRGGVAGTLRHRAQWAGIVSAGILVALGFGGYRYFASPLMSIMLSSPPEAGQGGSFQFSASGGDPGVELAYRNMRNPRGGEHLVSPAVPRDSDGRFVWVFSTDCQTPPGRHEVSLADGGGRPLTKAIAVVVRENPQCHGAVPDIQAAFLSITPEEVETGGSFRCRFTLKNQGARTASPSMTRLRLSRSPMRSSVSDVRLGDVPAPLIRPGEEATFEPLITLPASVGPGVYYVWVVADNNSDNVESFTHNNYARSIPLIVGPGPK